MSNENGKRLYVGNTPFDTTRAELEQLFGAYGPVLDVHLVTDRETGRPRGFSFVTMEETAAHAAIAGLNDTVFGGRTITVNEAKEREQRGGGGGGGGGNGRRDDRRRDSHR